MNKHAGNFMIPTIFYTPENIMECYLRQMSLDSFKLNLNMWNGMYVCGRQIFHVCLVKKLISKQASSEEAPSPLMLRH